MHLADQRVLSCLPGLVVGRCTATACGIGLLILCRACSALGKGLPSKIAQIWPNKFDLSVEALQIATSSDA